MNTTPATTNAPTPRTPTFAPTDPVPYGVHRGQLLSTLTARELKHYWLTLASDGYQVACVRAGLTDPAFADRIKLANYLHNNRAAIELELGETL